MADAYGRGPSTTSFPAVMMHNLDVETPANIYGFVDLWAKKRGEAVALVERGQSVSFHSFLGRADELARVLRASGVAPGERIVLTLRNGVAFAVAMLAAWRAGAIIVPLHVQLREREIAGYAADCGASAIIAAVDSASIADAIRREGTGIRQSFLLNFDGVLDRQSGTQDRERFAGPWGPILDDAPAVTMFSTGSSGLARRVTRSHRQLVGEALSVAGVVGMTEADRVLGVAPFFHAYGFINGLLCPLVCGCETHAVAEFFPPDSAGLIERHRLTGFPGVPFMFQLLADSPKSFDFSSLRYVLSAGAPLPSDVALSFHARYGISIRQLYGSTETGVISIEPRGADVASVGEPIPGVSVEILDDARRPVVMGSSGNVAVVSQFAARAHDGLITDRESAFEGDRFFPGDIGTIRADGQISLLGRSRGFVNVAGNKVDPTEIENVLKEMPAIREAVVVGLPDGSAGEKLKAYLVANGVCTRDDVYAFLRDRLADYKRPRLIEFREELPRSPLGKILRKYLVESDRGPRFVFDPRVGFVRKDAGWQADVSFPQLEAMSPILRSLLVTDGTVTRTLEAFFWEPVGVDVLLHADEVLAEDCPELDISAGSPVVRRQVLLRGRYTTTVYAFAETIIANEALTLEFREALVEGRRGIGELIREERIETYRSLVGIDRLRGEPWAEALEIAADAKVARRRYSIAHEGRAAILITEIFPEDRF